MNVEFLTTGQLFLFGGIAGLLVTGLAAVLIGRKLRRTERRLREKIWREYR